MGWYIIGDVWIVVVLLCFIQVIVFFKDYYVFNIVFLQFNGCYDVGCVGFNYGDM